jgi:hypothetical protein
VALKNGVGLNLAEEDEAEEKVTVGRVGSFLEELAGGAFGFVHFGLGEERLGLSEKVGRIGRGLLRAERGEDEEEAGKSKREELVNRNFTPPPPSFL